MLGRSVFTDGVCVSVSVCLCVCFVGQFDFNS